MKQQVRKEALAKRRSMSPSETVRLSMPIQLKALALCDMLNARSVFAYMSQQDEVQTQMILHMLRQKGVCVSVPVCVGEKMAAQKIEDNASLIRNGFNILEPVYDPSKVIPPEELDAALVPGVAFDRSYHRIGFGKGFYDTYLAGLNVVKIALAFDCQLYDSIPFEDCDVLMDYILTPTSCCRRV
ncbi:MAG: 5-formyltetrahydrofolate cyclo-ligase [Christensenellales bacterium]